MEKRAVFEEKLNSYTHGFGFLLSILGVILLINYAYLSGKNINLISSIIYSVSLMAVFLSSTIYHSISKEDLKQFFRKIDHSCIFIKIAGSYTPFALVILKGLFGWAIFSVVWGIALFGILMKLFFIKKMEKLSLILYLLMGWLSLVIMKPLIMNLSSSGVALLVGGGLFYSIGAFFYSRKQMPYSHPIWHLFVLAGSACHFFAIMNHVISIA